MLLELGQEVRSAGCPKPFALLVLLLHLPVMPGSQQAPPEAAEVPWMVAALALRVGPLVTPDVKRVMYFVVIKTSLCLASIGQPAMACAQCAGGAISQRGSRVGVQMPRRFSTSRRDSVTIDAQGSTYFK